MVLDKYITIKEKDIACGQTSSGFWYCKELRAENPEEAGQLMKDINKELNEVNPVKKEKEKK